MSKKLFFHQISVQLLLGVFFISSIVLGLTGYVRYLEQADFLEQKANKELETTAGILSTSLSIPVYNFDLEAAERICMAVINRPEMVSIVVKDQKSLSLTYIKQADGTIHRGVTAQQVPGDLFAEKKIIHKGEKLAEVIVGVSRNILEKELQQTMTQAILQFVTLVFCLIFLIIVFLRYKFIVPVQTLKEFTADIVSGALDRPPVETGSDEIGDLGRSIIFMRDSIKEKIEGLQNEVEERKRAEAALKNSEENIRITLNSIGDGVVTTDIQGQVTGMNPVAEQLTGWTLQEATGHSISEVFNLIDEETGNSCIAPHKEVLATGKMVTPNENTILISKRGDAARVANSAAPIRSLDKEIVGAVLVFRNVTEEYNLQKQLNQSRKLDAVGQLAGGIAHDFNNMLCGIIGSAELLLCKIGDNENYRKFLAMILESAGRASDLASNLLAFSRRTAPGSTVVDVHQCVNDAVAILKSTIDKRINIEIKFCGEKALVVGDPSQLQSVFLNMGINASHAMPEGGDLSFTTEVVALSEEYCTASAFEIAPDNYISIRVRDTGCGIDKKDLQRIFEPFYTTKEKGKGTGLGLSAAYGTIKQHHGEIVVESMLGKGTCFKVSLPLTNQEMVIQKAPGLPMRGTGKILLVDDEPVMLTTGSSILSEFGYEVID